MIQASIYGRAGKDARGINTKTGKPMTVIPLAVDVSSRDEQLTMWVSVVCFGKLAEILAHHRKGEPIAFSGRLAQNQWVAKDGQTHQGWQLIADSIHSARTVRPGGNRKKREPEHQETPEFNDELTF